jgi:cobalamin synthase
MHASLPARLVELLQDNQPVAGRIVTTAAIARRPGGRLGGGAGLARARRGRLAGRIGVVLGLLAAGIAFAMQEVIGALAGWANILSGRIFRVGGRIEMGGVRGDVIAVTPLERGGADPARGGRPRLARGRRTSAPSTR